MENYVTYTNNETYPLVHWGIAKNIAN